MIAVEEVAALLSRAEDRFGQRDQSYELAGIWYAERGPYVQYASPGSTSIFIVLSDQAQTNDGLALFQAAHEVVHLLAPTGGSDATVLEEGVATMFQHDVCEGRGIAVSSELQTYREAEARVRQLLTHAPDAIRAIRQMEPSFARVEPRHILAVAPDIRENAAIELCMPFAEWSTRYGGPRLI